MTTKIPDDVVEKLWRDLCEKSDRTSPAEYPDMAFITLDELRAAGRVFVEWEREQNIEIARRHRSMVEINEPLWHEGQDWACQRIEDAIHARSKPEKE